jgi:methyl-accepting chemotaxis protein
MRQSQLGLFWKYFLYLGITWVVAFGIITFINNKNETDKIVDNTVKQLKDVAGIVAITVDGDQIDKLLTSDPTNNPDFQNFADRINGIKYIYSNLNTGVPVSSISILTVENKIVKTVYRTDKKFQFLENSNWYDEISKISKDNPITTKRDYLERDEYIYSAFAQLRSQGGNYVVRVDANKSKILEAAPSFLIKFLWYLIPVLVISFILSVFLSRIVTRPINEFIEFVNKVSEGNYHLRLNMTTRDEMEKIGDALNVMLEKIEGLIETEADRDRLQKQITSLLQIVSAAADGDFTASAEVTSGALGALADSFNLMIAELSKLIRDVKIASDQMSSSTQGILVDTEVMVKGSEIQAKEIGSTYKASSEVAEIIKYANERTQLAAESARRASQVALTGTEVVKKSIEGMHRIRETVQETTRRVRTLGESSTQIGEIIEVISDIADRTNLLALNATIEAARAGDAGRGFAVVADEVRMLAERSSQAAKDIAELIESIQVDTKEAVLAMENGTIEVESGTKFADEAGAGLKEIMEMVQNSAKLITEISGAFQQQANASSDIAKAMERIASIAQDTAEGARKSRKLTEQMEKSSRLLNTAIAKFRLAEV